MSNINEADLTALLAELRDHAANGYKTSQYAALTALVAERYLLRKCVVELERRLESNPPADRDLRAEIDKLSSIVSILTCRVAALESAKLVGPHVPVNPWNPYPTTPWIIYGTRTSDRIEESA